MAKYPSIQGSDISGSSRTEIIALPFSEATGLDYRHPILNHLDIGTDFHTGTATGAQPLI
ncbi:hypothetical protein ES703_08044 [subsurface metagenome]